MVGDQTKNPNMKRTINEMIADLNEGKPLTTTFRAQSRHFDNVYLNMIEAGEVSGQLDKFIDKLVDKFLKNRPRFALVLNRRCFIPTTLFVVTLLIHIFMLTNVVPTFQEMYEGMGAELPGPTQVIVDASQWVADINNILSVLGVVFRHAHIS